MEPAVARIIDANANRAREALRVVEEFVRFELDDAWLSSALKSLRHDLASALGCDALGGVIRCRNIVSDVGRTVRTASEYDRADSREVVTAAMKRLTEALRSLEEYAKTVDANCAHAIEWLRYRAYEVERSVAIRIDARDWFRDRRLYVLITESLCSGDWLATARSVIDGGADCLQLREKSLPDRVLLERTRALATVCRESGVLLFVNDRPDIARLGGADGVHVGRDDLSVAEARRIVGPRLIVGCSTHSLAEARAAMADAPDYIAVGPMFASETKPREDIPGPALLAAVCAETSLPIVPIGGINHGTFDAVMQAGARCVCVCSAVISQPDAAAAARELKRRVCAARAPVA